MAGAMSALTGYRSRAAPASRDCTSAPRSMRAKHIRQYDAQKQDMPVAVAIGVDPTIVLASISKFPYGTDELSVAGGLRGELFHWFKCETVDLDVPANAEIVIEGFLRAGYREPEGPFGEFSGYMSPGGQQPVIEVSCITRRRSADLSLLLEPDAAERVELHPEPEPLRRVISPPPPCHRLTCARCPLH